MPRKIKIAYPDDKNVDALQSLGLTRPAAKILALLRESGGEMTPRQLINAGVKQPYIPVSIKKLSELGLVEVIQKKHEQASPIYYMACDLVKWMVHGRPYKSVRGNHLKVLNLIEQHSKPLTNQDLANAKISRSEYHKCGRCLLYDGLISLGKPAEDTYKVTIVYRLKPLGDVKKILRHRKASECITAQDQLAEVWG